MVQADGSGLKPLSEDAIPEDLTGVTNSDCILTYNHADRGVYILLPSPSSTPSATPSHTVSATPSATPSHTPSATPSHTPSHSPS
jgi:hypothetical protein